MGALLFNFALRYSQNEGFSVQIWHFPRRKRYSDHFPTTKNVRWAIAPPPSRLNPWHDVSHAAGECRATPCADMYAAVRLL